MKMKSTPATTHKKSSAEKEVKENSFPVVAIGAITDMRDKADEFQAKEKEYLSRFQNLLLKAPAAIAVFDGPQHRFVMANQAYQKQNNRKEKDFLGKSFREVFPELEGTGSFELFDSVYATGETFTASEYAAMIDADNNGISEKHYFNFSLEALKNESKEIYGVMVMAFDITEQVEAKKIIEESEQRFQAAIKAVQGILWTNNARGEMEGEQLGWALLTGQTYEEYQGYGWTNAVHPDDVQPTIEAWNEAVKERKTFIFEHSLKTKDGQWRDFSIRAIPLLNADGTLLQWVGVHTDITEKKQHEKALKENEKQFNTLANNIQNLAWMADGEGYIFWYNQRWYDYTGTTLEEMKGWGWEKVHHPEHVNHVVDFVKKAWHINEPFELTFPLRGANGEYRWFLTRAYPVTDEEGKIINWIGTNTDITEQKTFAEQLEEKVKERTAELNGKNDELDKMNKELESFAYISSHDLQEPLRKIQTFASRILDKEENNLSDDGKGMFKRMRNSAERMQTLIQDLLAYSRTNIEERKLEKTDLNKILEEVKDDLKEELKDKHATIEATGLCEAHIIPFQFRQLLHNLIGNSLKFSNPQHAPHIKIESEIAKGIKFNNEKLSPQKKYCHISVSDNGIGFEQQYSEKIFEVFQRLHGKDEYNGTGIGLAIVKKIVENHNGILTANGELNKGATFDIYIPSN